jgi:hypothetical protein
MCLFWALPVAASQYSVAIPIKGKTEAEVRDQARIEVQWKAARDYPVLISGVEQVDSEGDYRSEITALTAGALQVEPVSESWDRERDFFYFSGRVTLDTDLSIQMIQDVKDNLTLQRQLQHAYESMDSLMRSKTGELQRFKVAAQGAKVASKVHFARGSYEETMKARGMVEEYILSLVVHDYFVPAIESLKFRMVDVGADFVKYEIASDWLDAQSDACSHMMGFERQWSFTYDRTAYAECVESPLIPNADVVDVAKQRAQLAMPVSLSRKQKSSFFKDNENVYSLNFKRLSKGEIEAHLQDPGYIRSLIAIKFITQ